MALGHWLKDYLAGGSSGGSGGGGSVVHCPLTAGLGSEKKLKAGMTFDELAMADQIIFDETVMGRVLGTFVCVAKGSNSLAIAYPNGKGEYEIITLTPDDEGYPSATVSGGVS